MEIEVKILEINKEKTIKRLLSLGAKKILDMEVYSTYFNTPKMLRLRQFGDEYVLTYKEKAQEHQAKIMHEFETKVSDPKAIIKILENLGISIKEVNKKHRTSYQLNNTKYEFDTHGGIPTYLEIESPTFEELKKHVELIGYTMDQTVNWCQEKVKEYYS